MAQNNWSYKDPIWSVYLVTAGIFLLNSTDNFPMISVLRRIKYVCIVVLLIDSLRTKRIKINAGAVVVLGLLFTHTILFGYLWVNPALVEPTHVHAREMLVYLTFLMLLVVKVEQKKAYLEFLVYTVMAFTVFFVWTGVTHFWHFVNPIYYPSVFVNHVRIRSNFGTGSPNSIGYSAFVAIVFYCLLYYAMKAKGKLTKNIKLFLYGISIYTGMILFSSASRGSIISAMIFAGGVFILISNRFSYSLKKIILFILVALVIVYAVTNWDSIWANSNRDSNVSVNLPIFNRLNAQWKGMGYLESAAFYGQAYGYLTAPVDIYYLYIYLATGRIGAAMVCLALLILLISLVVKKKSDIKRFILLAYMAMLFGALWQVNLFTYRHGASLFINVLLLYFMSGENQKREVNDAKTEYLS